MKLKEITLEQALNNDCNLYLATAGRGWITITLYVNGDKLKTLSNDTISYDRYKELQDNCTDEQEFLELYRYFVETCMADNEEYFEK